MSKLEEAARIKLAQLMAEVQPIIDKHISNMDSNEINYILTNYRKYLKIDIERDLEKARTTKLTTSPLDDILNGEING
jgi:hypothetical protein